MIRPRRILARLAGRTDAITEPFGSIMVALAIVAIVAVLSRAAIHACHWCAA